MTPCWRFILTRSDCCNFHGLSWFRGRILCLFGLLFSGISVLWIFRWGSACFVHCLLGCKFFLVFQSPCSTRSLLNLSFRVCLAGSRWWREESIRRSFCGFRLLSGSSALGCYRAIVGLLGLVSLLWVWLECFFLCSFFCFSLHFCNASYTYMYLQYWYIIMIISFRKTYQKPKYYFSRT